MPDRVAREQDRAIGRRRAACARRHGRGLRSAEELGVSEATVRRDLQALGDQRLLERSHGGAVAHGTAHELPVVPHRQERRRARIAQAASELVTDGMAIGLTGGTTTTEVARMLGLRQGLTVVTNALNIAVELAVRPDLKLIVAGGVARATSYELVGSLADATLRSVYVDIAFVGVDGVDAERGLDDAERGRGRHQPRADGPREAHRRGRRREQARPRRVRGDPGIGRAHQLITNDGGDAEQLERLRAAGLAVTTV